MFPTKSSDAELKLGLDKRLQQPSTMLWWMLTFGLTRAGCEQQLCLMKVTLFNPPIHQPRHPPHTDFISSCCPLICSDLIETEELKQECVELLSFRCCRRSSLKKKKKTISPNRLFFLVQLFWCRNAPNLPDELVTLQCFCGPDRARQTILKVSKQTGEVAGRLMGKRRRRRNSDLDHFNLAEGNKRPPHASDNLRGSEEKFYLVELLRIHICTRGDGLNDTGNLSVTSYRLRCFPDLCWLHSLEIERLKVQKKTELWIRSANKKPFHSFFRDSDTADYKSVTGEKKKKKTSVCAKEEKETESETSRRLKQNSPLCGGIEGGSDLVIVERLRWLSAALVMKKNKKKTVWWSYKRVQKRRECLKIHVNVVFHLSLCRRRRCLEFKLHVTDGGDARESPRRIRTHESTHNVDTHRI